jgi:hypothetical protein
MKRTLFSALILSAALPIALTPAFGQVVINEFQYDDDSTDDREFVELFNSGGASVDISGWSVGGRDASGANIFVNIPAATTLAAGAYYVIGQVNVPNVNLVNATFLENDGEQLELWTAASGTGTLVDGVIYEGNKGTTSHGAISAGMAAQVGPTYWGNHQGTDLVGTPLRTRTTVSRHYDGFDSNNNGRNFGMLPSTPGTANSVGAVTSFAAPNVDALPDATLVSGFTGSFVGARVITPTVAVLGLNPNAIPAAPNSTKAIVAWDNSGGGNAVVSDRIFNGSVSYDIVAFFDTSNMTVNSNATNVKFRGTEQTYYGLGSIDAFANSADVTGELGLGTAVSANGATGVGWLYQKIGESALGLGDVSEKLILFDANDGGNANLGAGLDWAVLGTIDLSGRGSDWYRLSISVDAAGNGTATFDDQTINFTIAAGLVGEFYAAYREGAQLGATGVPDFLRPATFAVVPEPSTAALLGLGGIVLLLARRKK